MTNPKIAPKMWLLALALILGSLLLSACGAAPFQAAIGNVVTREYAFSDFDQVEVSDAFVVEIRQGDEYRVTIEIDEESLRHLEVNQRGDTLEIGLRPRPFAFFWFFNWVHRAEITMPSLVGVTASDATSVDVSGFRSDAEARFEVADASSLKGEIDTGDARLNASDASRISLEGDHGDIDIEARDASHVTLVGEGRNATIHASDASRVNLSDFAVQDAEIEASNASHVSVDVSDRFDAEATDASNITYYGNPTVGNTHSSDGSSIEARQR